MSEIMSVPFIVRHRLILIRTAKKDSIVSLYPSRQDLSAIGTEGPIFDLIQRCVARSISALLFRYRRGSPVWMPPRYYISWNGYYCHTHGLKTREMRARVRVMIGRAKSDEFISAREAWYLCYYDPGILMEILLVADLIRLVLLSWSRYKFYDGRNLWILPYRGK